MLGPLIYIYGAKCVWAASIFLEKKDGWGLRADNEKRKQTVAFYCLLVFRTLGWINNVFCTLGGYE